MTTMPCAGGYMSEQCQMNIHAMFLTMLGQTYAKLKPNLQNWIGIHSSQTSLLKIAGFCLKILCGIWRPDMYQSKCKVQKW